MRSVLSLAVLALLAPVLAGKWLDLLIIDPKLTPAPMLERDSASLDAPAVVEDITADAPQRPAEDACDAVCGIRHLDGAQSERDALCSDMGLANTLECALCIDNTWSDTTWEDSALAEYERIIEACKSTDNAQL
jgi:hypothetical protein